MFLSNGFKLLVSPKLSKTINDWFAEKFMVIYRADAIQLIRRFSDPQKKTAFVEKTTNEAAKFLELILIPLRMLRMEMTARPNFALFSKIKKMRIVQKLCGPKFLNRMEPLDLLICFRWC